MTSIWLIIFIVLIVGGFCQITTCDNPPSSNMYAWVRISNLKQDLDSNDFNGEWTPYSFTQCFDGVYIYQLSDGSLPNIYLCHAKLNGYWTITDTICNGTDVHRKAYCQRNRHDISRCSETGDWHVQTNATIYESGGNPPPVSIELPTDNPTTSPTKLPTISPTNNPTLHPTQLTLSPSESTPTPTNYPTKSPTKHLYEPNIPAVITVYCDDFANVSVSYDNGNSFTQIGYSSRWTDGIFVTINVTKHTIVRTDADDNLHSGGFISTVLYDGHTYSTINPISNSNWNIISALSGQIDPQSFVYSNRNGWNPIQGYIANEAVWWWNGVNSDNIRFEFDFGNIIRTQVPTNNPTNNPTFTPTNNPTLYTNIPTITPTYNPSITPTTPTNNPTKTPTLTTDIPTTTPTYNPTILPTNNPTKQPTKTPTYAYGIVDEMTTTWVSNIGNKSFKNTQSYYMAFIIILLCAVVSFLICCCILCVIYIKKRNKINNLKINRFETSPDLMKVASTSMAEMIVNSHPDITPIGNTPMDINTGNINPITPMGNADDGFSLNANPSAISVGNQTNKSESDSDNGCDDIYLYAKKSVTTRGNDNDNDSDEGIFDDNDNDKDIEEGIDELYRKQNPDIETAGYACK